jgi:hypothetical protein
MSHYLSISIQLVVGSYQKIRNLSILFPCFNFYQFKKIRKSEFQQYMNGKKIPASTMKINQNFEIAIAKTEKCSF